jgi:hypothetical protein
VTAAITELFEDVHRALLPHTPMPEFRITFFAYTNIKSTIRLRDGVMLVRISDLLSAAPPAVLSALAHILLAKIYRKSADPAALRRYRKHLAGGDLAHHAHLMRQIRGRKRLAPPRGRFYDLETVFEELNQRYFHGLLGRPTLTWSPGPARRRLGHFDPAHNAIVISRAFDDPRIPRYALDYVMYHEMLHLRHPVRLRGGRRCVHSAEFQEEERLFLHLDRAQRFLRKFPMWTGGYGKAGRR